MTAVSTELDLGLSVAPGLSDSVAYCRTLVRSRGSSFYHGMRLIPEPQRTDTYVLYAWLRHADDLADDPSGGDAATRARRLRRFWELTCRAFSGEAADGDRSVPGTRRLWPALSEMVVRRRLPIGPFRDSVRGQLSDLTTTSYETRDGLREYCRKVASTVGLLCVEIWGYDGTERARSLATERGIAFQITNILRDVREDAAAGRVYLPAEYTGGALAPEDVASGRAARQVRDAVVALCADARRAYDGSAALDGLVHRSARGCLWAMTERCRSILRQIEADPGRVLCGGRIGLGTVGKLWIWLRAGVR